MTEQVYFLHAPELGVVKIGVSVNPKKRMMQLAQQSPTEYQLLGTRFGGRSLEQRLHKRFAAHRVKGEWFSEEILRELLPRRKRPMPLWVPGFRQTLLDLQYLAATAIITRYEPGRELRPYEPQSRFRTLFFWMHGLGDVLERLPK